MLINQAISHRVRHTSFQEKYCGHVDYIKPAVKANAVFKGELSDEDSSVE